MLPMILPMDPIAFDAIFTGMDTAVTASRPVKVRTSPVPVDPGNWRDVGDVGEVFGGKKLVGG